MATDDGGQRSLRDAAAHRLVELGDRDDRTGRELAGMVLQPDVAVDREGWLVGRQGLLDVQVLAALRRPRFARPTASVTTDGGGQRSLRDAAVRRLVELSKERPPSRSDPVPGLNAVLDNQRTGAEPEAAPATTADVFTLLTTTGPMLVDELANALLAAITSCGSHPAQGRAGHEAPAERELHRRGILHADPRLDRIEVNPKVFYTASAIATTRPASELPR